jgi:hypothetical protein
MTAEHRGQTEEEDRQDEGHGDLGDRPAELLGERDPEHTPGIDGAQGDLHDHTGGSDQPPVPDGA